MLCKKKRRADYGKQEYRTLDEKKNSCHLNWDVIAGWSHLSEEDPSQTLRKGPIAEVTVTKQEGMQGRKA